MIDILTICTGNAARSVMAGISLSVRRPDLHVETAGTLVIDGQPMSVRTCAAIEGVGHDVPWHSSRQATEEHLGASTLIVALAPEHVEWIRRTHPEVAARTGTLKRLASVAPELSLGPDAALDAQVAALDLGSVALAPWEEVVDPGGGDADVFAACAREIDALVATLAPVLAVSRPGGQSANVPYTIDRS